MADMVDVRLAVVAAGVVVRPIQTELPAALILGIACGMRVCLLGLLVRCGRSVAAAFH
jgi:hypothetical protein